MANHVARNVEAEDAEHRGREIGDLEAPGKPTGEGVGTRADACPLMGLEGGHHRHVLVFQVVAVQQVEARVVGEAHEHFDGFAG